MTRVSPRPSLNRTGGVEYGGGARLRGPLPGGGDGRPIHGYGIIQCIHELTEGYMEVLAGTVYQILRNLEEIGLVTHDAERSVRGPESKVYQLTEDGREAVGRFD